MEYVIIGLLVVIIILVVILLVKGNNRLEDRMSMMESNNIRELSNFKSDIMKNMTDDIDKLDDKIEKRLVSITDKVNERLDDSFNKTNKTFTNVLERLSKIDEAQKKIDNLSTDIVGLEGILTDKKSRGIFGEINLKHILVSVFGDKNDKIYQLQYTLPNSSIADAILFTPEPLGTIAIDSKFPLENYQNMVDKNRSQVERNSYEKMFKNDVKKHIDAISSKYIIPGVTSSQAIMFLPAEAIFAEINAYHNDLVEYAYKKNVWITSPTTLISSLTTVELILKNMERDKYARVIHDELNKLGVEFSRYRERWDKLSRSIESVNKDIESINITTDKITKRFDSISDVNIDNKDLIE